MVANPLTVAILHGHKFDEEVEVPEKIIKKNKNKKNANKVFEVHPSG